MNKETYSEKEPFQGRIIKEISDMLGQKELNLALVKNKEGLLRLVDFFRREIERILDLQNEYPDSKSEILEDLILVRDGIKIGNFKVGRFDWYFEAFDKVKNRKEKWEKLEETIKKALDEDMVTAEYLKPKILGEYYKNLLDKVVELQK